MALRPKPNQRRESIEELFGDVIGTEGSGLFGDELTNEETGKNAAKKTAAKSSQTSSSPASRAITDGLPPSPPLAGTERTPSADTNQEATPAAATAAPRPMEISPITEAEQSARVEEPLSGEDSVPVPRSPALARIKEQTQGHTQKKAATNAAAKTPPVSADNEANSYISQQTGLAPVPPVPEAPKKKGLFSRLKRGQGNAPKDAVQSNAIYDETDPDLIAAREAREQADIEAAAMAANRSPTANSRFVDQLNARMADDDHGDAIPPSPPHESASDGEPPEQPDDVGWVEFHNDRGQLASIAVKQSVLTQLTFGLYGFWQLTNWRRAIWSHLSVNGEPFEYQGTGGELFRGAIIALLFAGLYLAGIELVIRIGVASLLPDSNSAMGAFILNFSGVITLVALFPLWQFAKFCARRYQLSRTSWRGIRLSMDGSAFKLAAYSLLWLPLLIVTAGLALPFWRFAREKYLTRHMMLGEARFKLEGNGWSLMPAFGGWLLATAIVGGFLFASFPEDDFKHVFSGPESVLATHMQQTEERIIGEITAEQSELTNSDDAGPDATETAPDPFANRPKPGFIKAPQTEANIGNEGTSDEGNTAAENVDEGSGVADNTTSPTNELEDLSEFSIAHEVTMADKAVTSVLLWFGLAVLGLLISFAFGLAYRATEIRLFMGNRRIETPEGDVAMLSNFGLRNLISPYLSVLFAIIWPGCVYLVPLGLVIFDIATDPGILNSFALIGLIFFLPSFINYFTMAVLPRGVMRQYAKTTAATGIGNLDGVIQRAPSRNLEGGGLAENFDIGAGF